MSMKKLRARDATSWMAYPPSFGNRRSRYSGTVSARSRAVSSRNRLETRIQLSESPMTHATPAQIAAKPRLKARPGKPSISQPLYAVAS